MKPQTMDPYETEPIRRLVTELTELEREMRKYEVGDDGKTEKEREIGRQKK